MPKFSNPSGSALGSCIREIRTYSFAGEEGLVTDFFTLHFRKPGLRKLLKSLLNHQVNRLVIHHKDRLLRFGSELLFKICQDLGVEVIVVERAENATFEQELASDIVEIVTVFSARLYGRRSHENRKKRLGREDKRSA